MMDSRILRALQHSLLWASAFVLVGCGGDDDPSSPTVIYTDQGSQWTDAARATYYNTDQGSRIIPYNWLLALKQPDGSAFASNQLSRYGFLPRDSDGGNTPALPVGFMTATDTGGVEQTAMNCSACHTRQITQGGKSYRIDGGPGIIDVESLFNDLDASVRRTLADPAVFEAFRVATQSTDGAALYQQLLDWYVPYHAWVSGSLPQPNMWGLGRVDAVSLIYNRVGGLDIAEPPHNVIPLNIRPGDAPVRYPFLWNSQKQALTQWTGFAVGGNQIQALSRDLGEVLGVFATFRPKKDPSQMSGYDFLSDNSVNWNGLEALGAVVSVMGPPRYPWPVDQALADRGATVFNDNCAGCHGINVPAGKTTWDTPIVNAGTDIRSWRVLLSERESGVLEGATITNSTTGNLTTLGPIALGADLLAVVVDGAINQKYPGVILQSPQTLTPKGYESKVLQGIWAAAPYLHNGSVASLEELLKPAAERKQSFQVGPAYDLDSVGLAAEQPQGQRYVRTTTDCNDLDSGNSNCGHDAGTTLPAAEKRALLEYLKTL